MELWHIFSFILLGLLAGLLAGLLGVSGGILTVPALFFLFHLFGFAKEHLMHLAIGTSLASMVFNTFFAAFFHRKNILWSLVLGMLPGTCVGALVGAFVATELANNLLKLFFGLFCSGTGFYFFFIKHHDESSHHPIHAAILNTIGFVISFTASILGIGGSIFTTPILMAYKVSIRKAIPCSAAIGFVITLIGSIAYLYFGITTFSHAETLGFLYLPAFITLAITTSLVVPFGVKLSKTLPTHILKKIFGVFLISIGLSMIFFNP